MAVSLSPIQSVSAFARRCAMAVSFALVIALSALTPANAEPIGWVERYALANLRQEALAELIPGSDDYYFYHCLYFQTTGQLEQSEAMLGKWRAEHNGRETPSIQVMTDRQRLLTYQQTPERTIDYLVNRLGINLDHAPPASQDQRRFPDTLDASTLQVSRLVNEALQRGDQLKPMAIRYLAQQFLKQQQAGLGIQLSDLLNRIDGPYVKQLDQLVIQELQSRPTNQRAFGDRTAHSFLTFEQLQNVSKAVPEIADDNAMVSAILIALRPSADQDMSQQPDVRVAYLERVHQYVQSLPTSYNSLKAATTYRLLEAYLQRGRFDRELFLQYLQLPRLSPIISDRQSRRLAGPVARPNDDFMQLALLPPIGNEEPLVRTHLEHFLRNADSPDAFSPYIQPDYLRQVFAETKLLSGVGRDEAWYEMLSPTQRQSLRDKVELDFLPTNPERFSADQPTELRVQLKNVSELVVRIYKINTSAYYRTHENPIDTDIDLDGLLATEETKLTYNQPAIRRHDETLTLPELKGRGVWIVDLVGQGLRARALVRRGAIQYVQSQSANGMVFTVINEDREPIPTATMWIAGRELVADDDGQIVVPPVDDPVSRRVILSDGELAMQVTFEHLHEQYSLRAGMHLERTQLQSGGEATLLIRPRLLFAGKPIDPKTLQDITVRFEATDLEGLQVSHEQTDLELDQRGELVVPFRVPSRLVNLKATLTGKIDRITNQQLQTMSTSRSWDVAGIRKTRQTHDAFLTRDNSQYLLEVRGRNGELVPGATVNVSLTTRLRNAPVEQTLQADSNGTVRLSELPHVASIQFSVAGGVQHQRSLNLDQTRWPNEIHSTAERPIRLAVVESQAEVLDRYRLMELREGRLRDDHSDQLKVEDGLLIIGPLAAGDYRLIDQRDGSATSLSIVAGPVLQSVAVGETRHRSLSPAMPLAIKSIQRVDGGLRIKLNAEHDSTRVHVYAFRFIDRSQPIDALQVPLANPTGRSVYWPTSGYVGDLKLGDEYRYVLRRRYADKYAGVMLPQPGVILNPWETQETENKSELAREGQAPPATANAPEGESLDRRGTASRSRQQAISSDYDFLAEGGIVLANLRPDEQGVINIPADELGGLPIVQVVAADALSIVQQTVTDSLAEAETTDMRLAKALSADVPYTFRRAVSVASPDQPLDLKSLGSAQLQVYSSIADLWRLYTTLVDDDRLKEFEELARWNELDQQQKLVAYSNLASHELHLFLWFHDRSFFQEVVAPYLENKKEKEFVDHWLLGGDLQRYTQLWRYNRLNAAERALLAMRVPDVRETVTRELRETVAKQEENYAEVRSLLESALKTRSLERRGEQSLGGAGRAMMFGGENGATVDYAFDEPMALGAIVDVKTSEKALRQSDSARMGDVDRYESGVVMEQLMEGRAGKAFFDRLAFYQELDSTKQWAESQWDRVRTVGGPPSGSLIEANAFWLHLATTGSDGQTVSTDLLRPTKNRHSVLVALATCGLPLSAGEVALPTGDETIYKPEHAVAIVSRQLRRLQMQSENAEILIGQRFERADEASSNNKPVAPIEEFLTGVPYRGHVIVSNPTSTQRMVEVFWQLPEGSLPLAGHQTTDSQTVQLKPYEVQAVAYEFYFPQAGEFDNYPATVSNDDELLARAEPRKLKAVDQLSRQDGLNWQQVAATGTPAQIRSFLSETNLRDLDWMHIAFRMKDQEVYKAVTETLAAAKLPIEPLWAYSLTHRDESGMQTFLSLREDLVTHVGPVFRSPLLDVDPIERQLHELLEYAPLVRARIHQLGDRPEILNPTFYEQYHRFMRVLAYSDEISDEQHLVLAYYLLIQNRISEAIEQFGEVQRDNIATQLQYDYMKAYLAMHQGSFDEAERIARQHRDHPIPRWNLRFTQLLDQLDQQRTLRQTEKLVTTDDADGSNALPEDAADLADLDRERRQAEAANEQPEVLVRVNGDAIEIDHRRAEEIDLNLYGVDLELLFSKAPFAREDLQRMAMVQPMRHERIRFDSPDGTGRFVLDDRMRRLTLLVEAVAGAERSTTLYYGGDLRTYVSETFGQLQASDMLTQQPVSAAYVKVYARYRDGSVRFYKDGYTDARGRFDYASLSAADAQGAERFAILVMSDEQGASLHDVAAPTR